jgi:hypothetical protein
LVPVLERLALLLLVQEPEQLVRQLQAQVLLLEP